MIKGSIQEEDITIINIYAPNIGAPQYIRKMLTAIKEETNSNTIIVGDFTTSLTPMDRSSRKKINKETQALNDTTEQIDLNDVYRTFHLKMADYTFFPNAHRTFSRIDQILGHKSSLGKFKKTEIISKHLFQLQHYEVRNQLHGGFPGGTVVKNLPAKTRDTGFEPGPGKIPHAAEQLSPCATTTEPEL